MGRRRRLTKETKGESGLGPESPTLSSPPPPPRPISTVCSPSSGVEIDLIKSIFSESTPLASNRKAANSDGLVADSPFVFRAQEKNKKREIFTEPLFSSRTGSSVDEVDEEGQEVVYESREDEACQRDEVISGVNKQPNLQHQLEGADERHQVTRQALGKSSLHHLKSCPVCSNPLLFQQPSNSKDNFDSFDAMSALSFAENGYNGDDDNTERMLERRNRTMLAAAKKRMISNEPSSSSLAMGASCGAFLSVNSVFKRISTLKAKKSWVAPSLGHAADGSMRNRINRLSRVTNDNSVCTDAPNEITISATRHFLEGKEIPPYCMNCRTYIIPESTNEDEREMVLSNLVEWMASSSFSEEDDEEDNPGIAKRSRPLRGSIVVILDNKTAAQRQLPFSKNNPPTNVLALRADSHGSISGNCKHVGHRKDHNGMPSLVEGSQDSENETTPLQLRHHDSHEFVSGPPERDRGGRRVSDCAHHVSCDAYHINHDRKTIEAQHFQRDSGDNTGKDGHGYGTGTREPQPFRRRNGNRADQDARTDAPQFLSRNKLEQETGTLPIDNGSSTYSLHNDTFTGEPQHFPRHYDYDNLEYQNGHGNVPEFTGESTAGIEVRDASCHRQKMKMQPEDNNFRHKQPQQHFLGDNTNDEAVSSKESTFSDVDGGNVQSLNKRRDEPQSRDQEKKPEHRNMNEENGYVEFESTLQIQEISTEEEEKMILQSYMTKRDIATKVIGSKLMEGYVLTPMQCEYCKMPLMERHSTLVCFVCPLVSKKAKKRAATKRKQLGAFVVSSSCTDGTLSDSDDGPESNDAAQCSMISSQESPTRDAESIGFYSCEQNKENGKEKDIGVGNNSKLRESEAGLRNEESVFHSVNEPADDREVFEFVSQQHCASQAPTTDSVEDFPPVKGHYSDNPHKQQGENTVFGCGSVQNGEGHGGEGFLEIIETVQNEREIYSAQSVVGMHSIFDDDKMLLSMEEGTAAPRDWNKEKEIVPTVEDNNRSVGPHLEVAQNHFTEASPETEAYNRDSNETSNIGVISPHTQDLAAGQHENLSNNMYTMTAVEKSFNKTISTSAVGDESSLSMPTQTENEYQAETNEVDNVRASNEHEVSQQEEHQTEKSSQVNFQEGPSSKQESKSCVAYQQEPTHTSVDDKHTSVDDNCQELPRLHSARKHKLGSKQNVADGSRKGMVLLEIPDDLDFEDEGALRKLLETARRRRSSSHNPSVIKETALTDTVTPGLIPSAEDNKENEADFRHKTFERKDFVGAFNLLAPPSDIKPGNVYDDFSREDRLSKISVQGNSHHSNDVRTMPHSVKPAIEKDPEQALYPVANQGSSHHDVHEEAILSAGSERVDSNHSNITSRRQQPDSAKNYSSTVKPAVEKFPGQALHPAAKPGNVNAVHEKDTLQGRLVGGDSHHYDIASTMPPPDAREEYNNMMKAAVETPAEQARPPDTQSGDVHNDGHEEDEPSTRSVQCKSRVSTIPSAMPQSDATEEFITMMKLSVENLTEQNDTVHSNSLNALSQLHTFEEDGIMTKPAEESHFLGLNMNPRSSNLKQKDSSSVVDPFYGLLPPPDDDDDSDKVNRRVVERPVLSDSASIYEQAREERKFPKQNFGMELVDCPSKEETDVLTASTFTKSYRSTNTSVRGFQDVEQQNPLYSFELLVPPPSDIKEYCGQNGTRTQQQRIDLNSNGKIESSKGALSSDENTEYEQQISSDVMPTQSGNDKCLKKSAESQDHSYRDLAPAETGQPGENSADAFYESFLSSTEIRNENVETSGIDSFPAERQHHDLPSGVFLDDHSYLGEKVAMGWRFVDCAPCSGCGWPMMSEPGSPAVLCVNQDCPQSTVNARVGTSISLRSASNVSELGLDDSEFVISGTTNPGTIVKQDTVAGMSLPMKEVGEHFHSRSTVNSSFLSKSIEPKPPTPSELPLTPEYSIESNDIMRTAQVSEAPALSVEQWMAETSQLSRDKGSFELDEIQSHTSHISFSSVQSRKSGSSVTSETMSAIMQKMDVAKESLLLRSNDGGDGGGEGGIEAQMDMAMLIQRLASAARAIKDLEASVQAHETVNNENT